MPRPSTINSVKIENIRGIESREFHFHTPELFANKIHLLVAPNGFGKSSLAHAFDCIKPRSLDLDKLERYNNDDKLTPKITITYTSNSVTKTVDETEIGKTFSVSVIRCRYSPKVKQANPHIPFAKATAVEVIEPTAICPVAKKPTTPITVALVKSLWGNNSKIVPDVRQLVANEALLRELLRHGDLKKFKQLTIWKAILPLIDEINQLTGTKNSILAHFASSILPKVTAISTMSEISQKIASHLECSPVNSAIHSITFGLLYKDHSDSLKEHLTWLTFDNTEKEARHLLDAVNSNPDWLSIKLSRSKGNLVATFPLMRSMSNGQRDLFSFICQLLKAKFDLERELSILIIDEVFDYLDECNLLFAQYFIREYLDSYRISGRELFPMVLTHLDPRLFHHAGFGRKNKLNVHLLDNQHPPSQLRGAAKIVKAREDITAKTIIEKYFFHYEPTNYDATTLFTSLSLPPDWHQSHDFYSYAEEELNKYKNSESDTDYVGACVGLRIYIEKSAFTKLPSTIEQNYFTNNCTDGTNSKLDYCSVQGVPIPESHRILGLIYNDMLHFKKNFDYISAIVSKMKNPAIRAMILTALSE